MNLRLFQEPLPASLKASGTLPTLHDCFFSELCPLGNEPSQFSTQSFTDLLE